jgi:transposase-like protein
VIPLFAFPEDIRKVISTTNALESVNRTLRKVTRTHRIFPSDEAVYKVVYLAMRHSAVARGPCRSATGNRPSIALQWNAPSAFLHEQSAFTPAQLQGF